MIAMDFLGIHFESVRSFFTLELTGWIYDSVDDVGQSTSLTRGWQGLYEFPHIIIKEVAHNRFSPRQCGTDSQHKQSGTLNLQRKF